jgi:hypothetical protein
MIEYERADDYDERQMYLESIQDAPPADADMARYEEQFK